jgi:hypothetical protein
VSARKWPSFLKPGGIKAATLIWRARHHGWKPAKGATIDRSTTGGQDEEPRPFVAFGIHPVTRQPYTWDGGEPGDVTWDELPLLTEAVADEIIKQTTLILRAQPDWIEKRPIEEPPRRPQNGLRRILTEPSFEEVEDALSCIPNDLDYDAWIDMGFAIADALGDAGRPLWEEFSRRYPDHVTRDINRLIAAARIFRSHQAAA